MVFRYRNLRHPLHQFRGEMDRLLSGFFGRSFDGDWPQTTGGQPAVNVWEEDSQLTVELEVPGIKNDQIDISVAGDQLSLKIERPEVQQEGVTYHRRERSVGSVTRILQLPADVDPGGVEAELHDGVLTITLPKAQSAKPRKISVVSSPDV